jgi:hypothetical protein
MNKRIRELSEQAEKYADDNFRGEPTWSEAFESKFAELIIRECANVIHSRIGPKSAFDVLEHFGVEESKREKIDKAMREAFKDGVDLSGKETP